MHVSDYHLEAMVSVPHKGSGKKKGWKKQFAVMSRRKIFFYNSELDKHNNSPDMILDIE